MLTSKRAIPRIRKPDWFPVKQYMHFDGPLKRQAAEALVTNPVAVAKHAFLPLIGFTKRDRRFRRKKGGAVEITYKTRNLVYCSNRDACIFGYYAHLLTEPYEALIKTLGIDDAVIGYRKVGSNIDLAVAAFAEIKRRGACTAFAFDISSFFDNIDHAVLRRNWCRVLGVPRLPDDHYAVFKALTRFSTVDRRACLRRLGYSPNTRDKDLRPPPLCSIVDYRSRIRGTVGTPDSLVIPWKKAYRVPQGTPISALAANISMIDFDVRIKAAVRALGGTYRRYSDDILIVVPVTSRHGVQALVRDALRDTTNGLRVKPEKTDIVSFVPGALAAGHLKPLQYLGFLFDGNRTLIRSNTLAKHQRRVRRAVRWAKRQHKKALNGEIAGRPALHKRELHARLTHLGAGNFITGYGRNSQDTADSDGIRRQLSRHTAQLKSLLDEA